MALTCVGLSRSCRSSAFFHMPDTHSKESNEERSVLSSGTGEYSDVKKNNYDKERRYA